MNYFLKNITTASVLIKDLGYEIDPNTSITINEHNLSSYLSDDIITALQNKLVLSKTDIGDTTGDFSFNTAIEKLSSKSSWKQKVPLITDLPTLGNEAGDIRLVEDLGMLYRFNSNLSEWIQVASSVIAIEDVNGNKAERVDKIIFADNNNLYIDQLNHIVYVNAPAAPPPLTELTLIGTMFTGKVSEGNVNQKELPGTTINYITKSNFEIKTQPDSDLGDKGELQLFINNAKINVIDLSTRHDTIQEYNKINFGAGIFELLKVELYNNFRYHYSWQAHINITDITKLRTGWNEFHIVHQIGDVIQTSNSIDIFYDSDTSIQSIELVNFSVKTPVYKYLSGVKYYGFGTKWDLISNVYNAFKDTYIEPILTLSNWPGLDITPIYLNNQYVVNVTNPPNKNNVLKLDHYELLQTANQSSTNAILTLSTKDVYGPVQTINTPSNNILIFSYGVNESTTLKDTFRDESYRLPIAEYDEIPSTITGLWNSNTSITNADLQVYMGKLVWPTLNFTNTTPTGNPNYSGLTGSNKSYYRAFKGTALSRAQGTLRLSGIYKEQLIQNKIKVDIKLPGQTGWLSLNTDYNYSSFLGITGDGCWINRLDQNNSDFVFTLDRFRTEFSNYMIIVRIIMPQNNNLEITEMQIIDW